MKKILCFVYLSFLSTLAVGCTRTSDDKPANPPAGVVDVAEVVKNNNQFAFDLHAVLAREPGNLFYSPYSIASAFGMVYAGARGVTADEIAKTLHFPVDEKRLHPMFASLREKIHAQQGKGCEIANANGLWVQKGYSLQPSFLQTAKSSYDAEAREVEFEADAASARQAVNDWVSERTRGKIKEILDPADLDAKTRLVLANAIYFKGDWVNSFPPKGTRKDRFYRKPGDFVEVSMMGQLAMFPYLETDSYQAVKLPYAGKHLSMCIFLPGRADGLPEFTKTMTNDKLSELLGKMARTEINVFLPRFKTRFRTDLKEPLKNMGMRQAFDSGKADFTGISARSIQKLQIAKVIHEAVVEVNETGTEAAGASVIEESKSAPGMATPRVPPTFRADRPFLFVIRHDATGIILFVGRVADPSR